MGGSFRSRLTSRSKNLGTICRPREHPSAGVSSAGSVPSRRVLSAPRIPESGPGGTYVAAPYGGTLCAMLAGWHCPRVNGQTLVNPTHCVSWDRAARVAMETGGLCRRRGEGMQEGEWGGSQGSESNKSDRSQPSPGEFGF